MTPYDMGRISAFLILHRKLEDRSDKRGMRPDEKELGALLREATVDELHDLEDLMSGQGFVLVQLTSFDIEGIGPGSRVYLAARRADMPSCLVDGSYVPEGMGLPTQPTAAKIWFTQIWLLHLDLLYTQLDRSPSERGRWINASFTREMLQDAVHAHINDHVRKLNAVQLGDSEVYDVLCAEKGTEISKRVKRFLDLMCKGGLLEERGEGVYRQTLLSAVEMKENFDRSLAPLMLASEQTGQRTTMGQVASALLTTTQEALSEGGEQ